MKGSFENCFGIKELDTGEIDFEGDNKAIIYAPNGVMKTSFAKTFDAISKGEMPKDELFPNNITLFDIHYDNKNITNKSSKKELVDLNVYVIKSLEENFTSDKVSTLLVDQILRDKYDKVLINYSDDIREFEKKLYNKSGIYYSKNKLRDKLFEDFNLDKKLDWNDFFKQISKNLKKDDINPNLSQITYADLINNKTLKIINDGDFQKNVEEYLTGLNELIQRSEFLNDNFDNYNATSLHKAFSKHNMFEANNRIILNNNQEIKNNDEWKELINNEIDRIESELDIQFRNIENSININNNQEGRKFKDIIFNNKFIINYFNDVENLKRNLWLSYIKEDKDTYNMLNEKVKSYTREIREIYSTAEKSSSKWHDLVDEFNNRFNVPFQLYIYR